MDNPNKPNYRDGLEQPNTGWENMDVLANGE